MERTETILFANLEKLRAEVERLNRRAAKLSVAPLTLQIGERRPEPVENDDRTAPKRYRDVVDVTLEGETPKLAGWRLAGVVDHGGEEAIIFKVPGETIGLRDYDNATPVCDHCHTARRRNETFVVANNDGRLKQVGRDCLADFLGGISPEGLLAAGRLLREALEALEEALDRDGMGPIMLDAEEYLGHVAASVHAEGWLARGKAASEDRIHDATSERAWDYATMDSRGREALIRDLGREAAGALLYPGEPERKLAREALEWARAIPPDDPSDYRSTLGRVARNQAIQRRWSGVLASAIPAYEREMGRERELKLARTVSKHVGEAGTRYKWVPAGKRKPAKEGFTLTLLHQQELPGRFGVTTLCRFVDPAGNRYIWFASGRPMTAEERGTWVAVEAGTTYRVDATVKAHQVRHGVQETVLTRVTFVGAADVERISAQVRPGEVLDEVSRYAEDNGLEKAAAIVSQSRAELSDRPQVER